MKKRNPDNPSGGAIFLYILSSAVIFFVALHNNPDDSILGILILSLIGGVVLVFILIELFIVLKTWFKW